MNKESIQKAIVQLKKETKKRNFSQSFDLIINLSNFNPKSDALEVFITLPHPKFKKPKVACFAAQELGQEAEQNCDLTITEADFSKYQDPKVQKKLARDYDYFIAQANLMPKVAQTFGKTLGIQGKMPNPKLGCVVPPNATLKPLIKKLQAIVKIATKKATNAQCLVGKEDHPDEQIIDNVLAVYQNLTKQLPQEKNNIKNIQLKLTMGKPVTIE